MGLRLKGILVLSIIQDFFSLCVILCVILDDFAVLCVQGILSDGSFVLCVILDSSVILDVYGRIFLMVLMLWMFCYYSLWFCYSVCWL